MADGTIDALRSQPDVFDYAQNNQYQVTMSNFPLTQFFCMGLTVPGLSLSALERATPLKIIPTVGDTLTYENFNMEFFVDEELRNYREVHDWMVNIGFPYSHDQFMATKRRDNSTERGGDLDLYSEIIVTILSSKNNPLVRVKIHESFPINLSGITYTNAETDITYLTAEVSFAYSWYEFESV